MTDQERLVSAMRAIEAAFLIGVPGTTEIWLVRHGDVYDGMTDHTDPELSPAGEAQVARLAARLGRLDFDAVISSPLKRALQTARAVSQEVRVDDRLREMEIELEDGRIEAAEGPEHVLERMRAAVAEVVEAHPGGRVLMVGHALSIVAYLGDVLRLDFGSLRVLPYYTSVSIVRILGDRAMAGTIADVAHLEGMEA